MAWTFTDILSQLAGSASGGGGVGSPEDGDKVLAFPPVPANQAQWWQDFAWQVRQEFARRCKFQSPYVSTVLVSATGLDVNGLGSLKLVLTTAAYEQLTGSAGVGTFVLGEVIFAPGGPGQLLSQATKAAIVTKVAGTVTAPVLNYTPIMAPATRLFTDFVNTDVVKGNTSAATCTAAAPVNVFTPT
jgi:hypothetical protein